MKRSMVNILIIIALVLARLALKNPEKPVKRKSNRGDHKMPEYQRKKVFKSSSAAKRKVNAINKNKNQYLKSTRTNKTKGTYTVHYSEFVPRKRR